MKARPFFSPLFIFLIVGMLSCSPPPVDEAAVREAITAVNQQFMDAYNSQDAEALAGLYTADGMLLPPNTKSVQGRENIQNFWGQAMSMGPSQLKLETTELYAHAEEATEMGMATVTAPDGTLLDTGPFMVIWKKVDGSWYLHRDIWNSDMPPPAPSSEETGEAMGDDTGEEM